MLVTNNNSLNLQLINFFEALPSQNSYGDTVLTHFYKLAKLAFLQNCLCSPCHKKCRLLL